MGLHNCLVFLPFCMVQSYYTPSNTAHNTAWDSQTIRQLPLNPKYTQNRDKKDEQMYNEPRHLMDQQYIDVGEIFPVEGDAIIIEERNVTSKNNSNRITQIEE